MESLKVKPLVREVFADNGEHSHYELLDAETGKVLWTEEEKDEKFEKAAEPMIKIPCRESSSSYASLD